jgi:hypothetical protein
MNTALHHIVAQLRIEEMRHEADRARRARSAEVTDDLRGRGIGTALAMSWSSPGLHRYVPRNASTASTRR